MKMAQRGDMKMCNCRVVAFAIAMVLLCSTVHGFFVKSYGRSRSNRKRNHNNMKSTRFGPKIFFKGGGLPDDVTVVDRLGSTTLTCEAAGVPGPTIHWLHNGERIPQSPEPVYTDETAYFEDQLSPRGGPLLRMSTTRSELHIPCVDEYNIGKYHCIAESPYQRIYTSTKVILDDTQVSTRDDLACPDRQIDDEKPAHIYMWSKNRLEFEGASVQLFCRVEGTPKPLITWYDRLGKLIDPSNPHYQMMENGDLLVKEVTWAGDMGRLTCRAENQLGEDSTTTFLYPTV